jgi:hypothetical protein
MHLHYSLIRNCLTLLLAVAAVLHPGISFGQSLPGPGNSLTFNGFSTYINCGTSNRTLSNQLTVEAWIKSSSAEYQWIVGKYLNSNFEEKGFHLYINGGLAYFNGRIGAGTYLSSGPSTTRVNDGRWHHIVGTSNGNVWRVYVDGVQENSTSYGYTNADFTTTIAMNIGNYAAQSDQYFQGEIDEVRVWRTVRTAAEIQANMCRKFATAPADLVAYYRLDQSSGLVAIDQGSQPTNGSLVNFSAAPWHLSGAALGDASVSSYQTAAWAPGTKVALASVAGDSASVSGLPSQTNGVQLYTVNSAPSIAAAVGATSSYFGVFTASPAATTLPYSLRLHPLGGASCRDGQQRTSNDQAWTSVPSTTTSTGTSLLLGPLTYRGEYILTSSGTNAPLTITGDSAVCAGATGQLTAVVAGATAYRWNTGATTPTLSGVGPGTYSVTVTFAAGCTGMAQATIRQARAPIPTISGDSVLCLGTTGRLTASAAGPVSYRWNTGATSASISITQGGTYTVTATSPAGCQQQASFRVRAAALPQLVISGDSVLCPASTGQLTASTTAPATFRWSTGATTASINISQTGTYSVVATSAAGCQQQASFRVRVLVVPPLTISGDSAVCPGATGQLTAAAVGATTYRWNTGATTSVLRGVGPGTYSVTVSFASGCSATAQTTIRQARAPMPVISGDSVLCPTTAGQLTATAVGTVSYRWNTGVTTASISITQGGTYTVTATSPAGCQQQASFRVRAAAAVPSFTLGADTTLCEGDRVVLRGPSGSGLRYQWSDGSTGQQLVASTAGTYSLRVSNTCGTAQATRVVSTRDCLNIPNIITPNHDKLNDLFTIEGLRGDDWSLDVYNRWGGTVLHTTSYHNDWGTNAAPGVYYVLLRRASTGYTYKGWVEVRL